MGGRILSESWRVFKGWGDTGKQEGTIYTRLLARRTPTSRIAAILAESDYNYVSTAPTSNMCMLDITFFIDCPCIVVGFSDPDCLDDNGMIVDSLGLPPALRRLRNCAIPHWPSLFRRNCDFSGLFCPQREFFSTFRLKTHTKRCRKVKSIPVMTVSGMYIHFLSFTSKADRLRYAYEFYLVQRLSRARHRIEVCRVRRRVPA